MKNQLRNIGKFWGLERHNLMWLGGISRNKKWKRFNRGKYTKKE
jgi:hypothetical protein